MDARDKSRKRVATGPPEPTGLKGEKVDTLRDVSDKLRNAEDRFRLIVENVNEAVIVTNESGFEYINPKGPALFGLSEEELISRPFVEFIHPDDRERVMEFHGKGLRNEHDTTSITYRILGRGKTIKWVEASSSLIRWNGKPAALTFINDITELTNARDALKRANDELEQKVQERTVELKRLNEELQKELSERRKIEEVLRESEQNYLAVLENSQQGIVVGQGPVLKFANSKMGEITGYTREEMITTPFLQFIHPDDHEKVMSRYLGGLEGMEQPHTFINYRLVCKDGTIKWAEENGARITWNGGPATLVFLTDITEKLEIEQALMKSEEDYRTLVEHAEQGIVVGQDDGLKFANRKIVELTGYTREELLSTPFLNFIHPEDHESLVKRYVAAVAGIERTYTYSKYRIIKKDGSIMWVEDSGALITWDGRPATLVFMTDITEKLRIEQALMESERKYRNLFETSREIVFLATVKGRIIDINPAGERLLGYGKDHLMTKEIADVIVDPPCNKGYPELMAEQGFVQDFPLTLKRKDGALIDCVMTSTFIQGTDGEITGYQGIIKDITDHKKFLDVTFDSIADGVYAVDTKWTITMFNAAAERITGVPREEAIGKKCTDILNASVCGEKCAVVESMRTARPVIRHLMHVTNSSGVRIPVSMSATALRDKDNNVIGGVTTLQDLSTIEQLKKEIDKHYTYQDIVSKNKRIREIFDILPFIAESDSTVLIEGRSGTGKELFARAIHDLSPRKRKPFVAVNCGALPETLLESELFGYVVGAFTNAVKDKPGRFALAEGGTIFLDEITEMSPALQVKLLRVLQAREYEPLGSVKSSKADVKIIASTNRNISGEVAGGRFREDLYYRLNIVTIVLPDLRERREDIPLLVDHFIGTMSVKKDRDIRGVSDEVMNVLMSYDYPGNIRELENVIEHAFVLCRGPLILPQHLPPEFLRRAGYREAPDRPPLDEIAAAERRIIRETLARYDGNKSKAAQALNMGRTTLWRKIREYGLE